MDGNYFIGVQSIGDADVVLACLQHRAQQKLATHYGHKDVVVTHGTTARHVRLVSPFVRNETLTHEALIAQFRDALVDTQPTPIELVGFGGLAPHTIFASVGEMSRPGLERIRSALHRALNIPLSAEFHPHVSLARYFPECIFMEMATSFDESIRDEAGIAVFPVRFPALIIVLYQNKEDRWQAVEVIELTETAAAAA